jgi:stress-induced-phosphoprotein 1
MADALKAEGNKLFAEKKFQEAVDKFSQAIELDPTNHVLYSNRSGAYASLKDYDNALEDAQKTTELKPDWSKGFSRKGGALHGQGDLVAALDAYEEALKLDANNAQAKSGKDSVQRAIEAEARADGADPSGGLGNMFNDPNLFQKLAKNPKTSSLLGDPQFMQQLQQLKNNPSNIGAALGDPRMMSVLSVLLGIDMSMGGPSDIPEAQGSGVSKDREDEAMPDAPSSTKTQQTKAPEPEPEPEETEEDQEAAAAKKAQEDADAEKKLGTENYKKRQFDEAIAHYETAWSLHKDITYLTNLSAAKYEKGDYKGAITACEEAIEYGRTVRADFKIVAKAYGRIGSSYEKLNDLPLAITNYQKALTEHRTPEILTKLRAAEKAKIENERTSYINPEEAEKARELGNAKFKEADWPAAVAAYTEMIKRAPEDPRGYSNRAACFIKLLTFPSAVTDCDDALKKDKHFIRAYLRKAQALFAMREYSRCVDVCTEALEADTTGANTREIEAQQSKALNAQYSSNEGETEEQTMERIQRDPEIAAILQDPVMNSILQQAKGDPKALQDHMKNPGIKAKIQKLVAAGVIRMGR